MSGWATFTLGFAAPTAVIAVLAIRYLSAPYTAGLASVFPSWAVRNIVPVGATLLILTIGLTHTRGHRHSSWLQITATSVTAAVLLLIAVVGLAFGRGDWNHLASGTWPTSAQWPALAIGLVYVGYAYAGWNGAAYLAGEIRDPVRNLPRCLIGGAATVVVLYLLVNLAYVFALDAGALAGLPNDEVDEIAGLAVRALFGETAARAAAAALGLCLVAAVSAYLLTGPRVAYAMAVDGMFPGFAARLHPTRQTPAPAIITQTVAAAALVWAGTFRELLDYASVGLALLTGLTIASVFALRSRSNLRHPYRMPLYPLPPLCFLILTGWTVGYAVYSEVFVDRKLPGPALLSLLTLLIGIPLARFLPGRSEQSLLAR